MIKECYTPLPIGVDTSVKLSISTWQIAGFLAKTSGTLTVVDRFGVTIVSAVPVTAGVYTPMPFSLRGGNDSAVAREPVITTAGGASGTLGF